MVYYIIWYYIILYYIILYHLYYLYHIILFIYIYTYIYICICIHYINQWGQLWYAIHRKYSAAQIGASQNSKRNLGFSRSVYRALSPKGMVESQLKWWDGTTIVFNWWFGFFNFLNHPQLFQLCAYRTGQSFFMGRFPTLEQAERVSRLLHDCHCSCRTRTDGCFFLMVYVTCLADIHVPGPRQA